MPTLSIAEIADLYGTTIDRLDTDTIEQLSSTDWSYELLPDDERDAVIVDLLNRIENRKFTTVENEDKSRWVKGWQENYDELQKNNGNLEALVPKYYRAGHILRLKGNLVRSKDPNFELNWFRIFSNWYFSTQLAQYDNIFEFGSGSGINVANLAKLFPDKTIYGLDWVQPAVDIVESLRTVNGFNTHGRIFDFFHPDETLEFPENTAVLTVGAMEQTGENWQKFLNFLLRKKPARVFHIEPIYEWYDPNRLVDYTAIKAHEVRNFWRGFPPALQELEKINKVTIYHCKRAFFGSIALEGWSRLNWSPN